MFYLIISCTFLLILEFNSDGDSSLCDSDIWLMEQDKFSSAAEARYTSAFLYTNIYMYIYNISSVFSLNEQAQFPVTEWKPYKCPAANPAAPMGMFLL